MVQRGTFHDHSGDGKLQPVVSDVLTAFTQRSVVVPTTGRPCTARSSEGMSREQRTVQRRPSAMLERIYFGLPLLQITLFEGADPSVSH